MRGVHVPNLFQICWKTVASDGSGSHVRRPIFVLSDRFSENFGVRQAGGVEKGLPPPASGDDVNYYQLAIQHSEGLSKDAVFSSMREMLIRLGEAAQAGKDLRLDLGAGHLCVAEREVSFEFGGGLGAAKGDGGGERTSHLDPMTSKQANKKGGGGGVSLLIGGSAIEQPTGGGGVAVAAPAAAPSSGARGSRLLDSAGGRSLLGGSSMLGGGGGGSVLTAEEEMRLFADVDALDPETVVSGMDSAISGQSRAIDALAGQTREQIAAYLNISDPAELGGKTVDELGEALNARAAALEKQLKLQKQETDAMEARLKAIGGGADPDRASHVKGGPPSAARLAKEKSVAAAREAAAAVSASTSQAKQRMAQPPSGAAALAEIAAQSSTSQLQLGVSTSQISRPKSNLSIGSGGSAPPALLKKKQVVIGGAVTAGPRSMAEVGPPMLSVGFGGGGPGAAGAAQLAPLPPRQPVGQPAPLICAAMSDTSSQKVVKRAERIAARGPRVPVAPPLPPFRYPYPQPNDAANRAWKHHAAHDIKANNKPSIGGARSVGGPAPPFLAAPPVVAAAAVAKSEGKAWAG